jgi:hypothetical protein
LPVVTLTATDGGATEAGQGTGTYLLSRAGGNLAQALSVRLAYSGSATHPGQSGPDYTTAPALTTAGGGVYNASIQANQASLTVTLTPVLDNLAEGDEAATYTVAPSTNSTYLVGAPDAATVTIADDPPIVNLVITDDTATESPSTTGAMQFSRSGGNLAAALQVRVEVSGTATIATDYNTPTGWTTQGSGIYAASIQPNQATLNATVTPINDTTVEVDELATFTLAPSNATPPIYTIGPNTGGSITITSNE